jgi:hypothetical protein
MLCGNASNGKISHPEVFHQLDTLLHHKSIRRLLPHYSP